MPSTNRIQHTLSRKNAITGGMIPPYEAMTRKSHIPVGKPKQSSSTSRPFLIIIEILHGHFVAFTKAAVE